MMIKIMVMIASLMIITITLTTAVMLLLISTEPNEDPATKCRYLLSDSLDADSLESELFFCYIFVLLEEGYTGGDGVIGEAVIFNII